MSPAEYNQVLSNPFRKSVAIPSLSIVQTAVISVLKYCFKKKYVYIHSPDNNTGVSNHARFIVADPVEVSSSTPDCISHKKLTLFFVEKLNQRDLDIGS